MRIALITDDFLPHRGGSRVYYHHLMARLADLEPLVLTRRREGDAEFDGAQPYRIVRCGLREAGWLRPVRLQHLPLYANLVRHALGAVRRHRPDVILAGELVPTGPVAALLAWILRRPLVVFTHAEGPPTLARTRWQSGLARWVCRRATVAIAASDNARTGLVEALGVARDKVRVVLPGVGDDHFDQRFLATPCARATPYRLLSVGRLVSRKGHRTLIEAMPRIRQRVPDLRCTIVGEGPMEADLRKTIERLDLTDRVELVGGLSDADLLRAYAQSDCFVQPNRDDPATGDTEGFGIVFGEASAHGLPVIGGQAGGTAHSIRHAETGLRVEGTDAAALADAIVSVLSDPERARAMGERARRFAQSELRWPSRADQLRKILRRLPGTGR
jgi:phosphatidylinositol alpha-1,6-mannosyltransferase